MVAQEDDCYACFSRLLTLRIGVRHDHTHIILRFVFFIMLLKFIFASMAAGIPLAGSVPSRCSSESMNDTVSLFDM